jgi:RNA polymerase sigma-70 factor (ECF subfamily)
VTGTQRALVARAIGGDRAAFTSLVDASLDRLYALATLILRDADRAEDAVQEALLSAWRNISGLRDPDAWSAWIHRLTVHACYRLAKKERSRRLVELRVLPDFEPRQPFDAVAAFADRDQVDRLLEGLSVEHRAVVVLRFHLDLPIEEIGRILDLPGGTVKSRLSRALDALRRQMAEGPATVAPIREGTA